MTKLDPISEDFLITVILRDNKLASIVRDTKKIDKDNNGYVLANELNKIYKSHYQKELEGKTLNKILRPFGSIQNKQLIDYKKFNFHLLHNIKSREIQNLLSTKAGIE
jgi:Ca2+-binding EF-hand superfamily protein